MGLKQPRELVAHRFGVPLRLMLLGIVVSVEQRFPEVVAPLVEVAALVPAFNQLDEAVEHALVREALDEKGVGDQLARDEIASQAEVEGIGVVFEGKLARIERLLAIARIIVDQLLLRCDEIGAQEVRDAVDGHVEERGDASRRERRARIAEVHEAAARLREALAIRFDFRLTVSPDLDYLEGPSDLLLVSSQPLFEIIEHIRIVDIHDEADIAASSVHTDSPYHRANPVCAPRERARLTIFSSNLLRYRTEHRKSLCESRLIGE